MGSQISKATRSLFQRYRDLIETSLIEASGADAPPGTDLQHLHWMCVEAMDNIHQMPIDKASRWLGFVQGCMVMHGLISVEAERDFSRPLFHAAYKEEHILVPDSMGRENP